MRREAIEVAIARTVLSDGSFSHADAKLLALRVLTSFGVVFSPSTTSSGGGENPAAPAIAPVSTKSDAGSPARNLEGPSGRPVVPKEADTVTDVNAKSNPASVPTIYVKSHRDAEIQDERVAAWLESHAATYEYAGFGEIASVLRKKAMKIRRRDYLEG